MSLAIANGALREKLIVPLTGDTAGHAISSLILCFLTFLAAFVSINWRGPDSVADAMKVGLLWLLTTLTLSPYIAFYLSTKA
jgi:hypothetical protein